MRIAVIEKTLCKPSKCNLECIRFCPVNRSRKRIKAIELGEDGKPIINEGACIGCNICVKKCPYSAISIENLPDELEKNTVHRYGPNAFKLYGLPVPKKGLVVGIIGKNGTGKTTSLRILAGEITPNLGDYSRNVEWNEVIRRFRGSELQSYFEKLSDKTLKVAHKIQYVDLIPKCIKGTVGSLLKKADERKLSGELLSQLDLDKISNREIKMLSGGELQKFMIAAVLVKNADVYIFDEPSSYLDVRERIRVAEIIREYVPKDSYVMIAEHDLAMLDYLSDNICIIYGEPGVYGIVSKPYGCRTGINNFLKGYLPAENMRIRREPIVFHVKEEAESRIVLTAELKYLEWSRLRVKLDGFKLDVEPGELYKGEVIGVLGPNGIGKTTFVRALAGELEVSEGIVNYYIARSEKLRISYKPQYVRTSMFKETVRETLESIDKNVFTPGYWFYEEVVRPLRINKIRERKVESLSGGELQKLAIAKTLVTEADLYLLDEPSAYLDVEERLCVAKVVRRLTENRGVSAIVVEHDVSIIDYIANRVIVFSGEPGVYGFASKPCGLRDGMNRFLKQLEVTFRRDPETGRPRINKKGSFLDRYQKRVGEYYYTGYLPEK